MKKIYKLLLFIICGIVLVTGPYFGLMLYGLNTSPKYQNTYYAALSDKFNNLKNDKEKKIILIGGSNVAFGFQSSLIEKGLNDEYKVHNFGLYAALGTKIMIDLAKVNIGKDDLVFVLPEINEQSMSLYFSSNNMLKALETNWDMYNYVASSDKEKVRSEFIHFLIEKKQYKDPIEPTGVYQRKNFNSYGDIEYLDENHQSLRINNIMSLNYDPTMNVTYNKKIVSDEFIDYLNDFNKFCNKKGAKLYYGFSPVNTKSVISNEKEAIDLYWTLRERLDFKVIGNPFEYILDENWFYDSNFHLNDAGSIVRTKIFLQDIFRDIFESDKVINIPTPDKPELGEKDEPIGEDSESAYQFEYEKYEDSLIISHLKDEYKSLKYIDIPKFYNGMKIVGIKENAFENSQIEELVIPKTIKILFDGCFGNCEIATIYMESDNPNNTIVSYTGGLVNNVKSTFTIYVPENSYGKYITDYYWGAYSNFMKVYLKGE